ncbi:MAG TPA: MIP/aquaporin family protein [Puia sp.]|nr:MIP/aquaporin family protein [Puia sp.]
MIIIKKKTFHIYLSEFIGVFFLVLLGLSIVVLINGDGSPVKGWIPGEGIRRAVTGWLFGTTGCLITISRVGKISGAHINPIVSIAFLLKKKLSLQHTLGFIIAQMTGAVAGALPLLLWGAQGRSVGYGATVPGPGGIGVAFIGETITSFLLIAGIFFFTGHKKLKRFTPYLMPFLYCSMVWAEGTISGTSTNPARSFGPAVVSGIWNSYWIYWAAPVFGALLAVGLFEMPFLWKWKTEVPKVYQA